MNSIATTTDIASADFRVEADSKGEYDTFEALYKVNVEKYLKKKKGDYLPWSMAWGLFQHYRPDSTFEFEADRNFDSGEVEVVCTVKSLGRAIQMILPVLGNTMQPVINPSRHAINTARMRCFTKAIAMHGLGLSCWNFVAIDEIENPGDKLISVQPEISEISEISENKAAPKIQKEAAKILLSTQKLEALIAKIKTGEYSLKKAHDWFAANNIGPTNDQIAEVVAADSLRIQNEEQNRETN
jgi:hypothetical protein|tara:strand:+ start:177 stop:902 length:726 start_codon:yes stop_codon:yes gene_type:complete